MELFFTFVKIGLFTFGGGYAMISMIENNCVEKKAWITHDEMMDVTVIAESTPGPIAINCATFTGYKKAGFLGALVATLGMVVPSFIVIFLISMFLDHFLEITIVANAFKGIKAGIVVLILFSGFNMFKALNKRIIWIIVFIAVIFLMILFEFIGFEFSSIYFIVIGGLIGYIVSLIDKYNEKLKQVKGDE